MDKLETLKSLLQKWGHSTSTRGRPPSVFSIAPGRCHELSRGAYILRYNHFKLVVAVEQGKELKDPLREVKNGSVYSPLWTYLHYCLPDYPERDADTARLGCITDLNLKRTTIHDLIQTKLNSGEIQDAQYEARLRDDERFLTFAECWFRREAGNRAISGAHSKPATAP